MKCEQLTFAREYRGFTQTALAAKVKGLSQSNLSKYEKGFGGLSDNMLGLIMSTLDFPMKFLDMNIVNKVDSKHYRKKATITVKTRNEIDRTISLIAYCFDWLSEFVEIPDYSFGYYDMDNGISPEELAGHIRNKYRLGMSPISDICNFLERNGVFIYMWDSPNDEFDGVSLITDAGNHLIIVNRNRSNDRVRFTLAHELGHILMHECPSFPVFSIRDKEKEANAFASELLLPSQAVRNALHNVRLGQFPELKRYWLVSMASLLEKAKNINAIASEKYKSMRMDFSRRHWNKKEPYEVPIDSPTVFEQAYRLVSDTLGYSISMISESTGLPEDVLIKIFGKSARIISLKPLI